MVYVPVLFKLFKTLIPPARKTDDNETLWHDETPYQDLPSLTKRLNVLCQVRRVDSNTSPTSVYEPPMLILPELSKWKLRRCETNESYTFLVKFRMVKGQT
jgi:hypothetical protein